MSLATLNININANANVAVSEFGKVQVAAKDSMGKSSAAVDGLRDSMAIASRGAEQSMQSMSRSMNAARDATTGSMGKSADSVDQLATSVLAASQSMEKAAASIQQSMAASGNAVVKSADESAKALDSLNDVDLTGMQKGVAASLGATFGAASVATKTFLEDVKSAIETKLVIIGLALATGVAAAVFTGLYAAYKATDFVVGLFTGESYKSASIDALTAVNDKVKELQDSLHLTAQEAMATGAALENLGVSKSDYTSVYVKASEAIHNNVEEMDRLGVQYGTTEQIIHNANEKLNEYTEGWDRNQAAAAMGLGTAAQVAAAAKVTSAELSKAKERLDDYNLGLGGDTQEAVKRYEAAMIAFNRETDLTAQGFSRAWADQIMPVLTDLAEFLAGGLPYAVNAFRYSMATITSLFYGLKTVVYMVSESILGSIEAIGFGLGGLASAAMKALSGDFSGAKNALVQGWTDAKTRLGGIGDNIVAQAKANSAAMRQAWAMDDRAGAGSAKPKGKDWIAKPEAPDDPAKEKKAAQVAAEISDYEKLMKAINEKISVQELEIAGDHALTDGEKMAAKFATDLRDNKLNLIATAGKSVEMQKIEIAAGLEKLIQDERANEAKKAAIKMADELAASGQKEIKALEDQLKAQRDHNDEIGLTVEQLGVLKSSKLDAAAASDTELAANLRVAAEYAGPLHDAYLQYADDLERAAKLNRDLSLSETDGAAKQSAADAAKKKAEEWQKTIDQYDDVFRKGFADMVNNGKGAWKSFTTSLVTTFKTSVADQIYKMFAQPFVVRMVGSLLGVTGSAASGMASAADSTGGIGSTISMLSSVKTAYSAITTGFSGMSASVTNGVQAGMNLYQGSSSAAAMGAYGPTAAGGNIATSALASNVGAYVPAIAVAVASYFGARAIAGQYRVEGIGAALNYLGLVGGLVNRAFGMGDKKVTSSGIEGSFGSNGFSGNNFANWKQDGGWFRSDKKGKNTTALDEATLKQFTDGFSSIKSASSDFAKSLGIDATSIANYSQKISLELTGDAAKDQAAITKLFSDMGDTLATQLAPNIAEFSRSGEASSATLQRLSVSLSGVNGMLDTLNLKLYDVSIAGGDAASKLVDLFGGLEKMQATSSAYFGSYYSEQEKVDIATRQLSKTFADLGFVMPSSNAELRTQIEAQQALGESGQAAYVQLMGLSGSFAALTSASEQLAASTKAAADAAMEASQGALDRAKTATDSALQAVQRAIDAEKSRIGVIRDVAAESVRSITGVFGLLKEQIGQLYGTVESTSTMQAAQGSAFIDAALTAVQSSGYLPDQQQLASAIAAARGGLDSTQFATQFEADKAALVMAGKLSQLQTASGYQLTAAEQSLKIANDQLSALDSQLEYAQKQVDALNGINTSVLSVTAAIAGLSSAIAAAMSAQRSVVSEQRAAAPYQAPPTSGSGAGGSVTVSDLYTQALGRAPDAEGLAFWTSAFGSTVSAAEADSFFDSAKTVIADQKAAGTWDAFQEKYYPKFASGGDHLGGLRIVGENGPELEATGPSRIFNASQTRSMLSGGGNTERLERLVEGLTAEVQRLQGIVADGNKNTSQLADQFDNVTEGGNGIRNVTIEVRT